MLARLQEQDEVETAEVDRRGELVRLRLKSTSDVSGVMNLLLDLGFAGEVVGVADVGVSDWYGLGRVGELSQEEGRVIAQRIVPSFALENGLTAGELDVVTELVATSLYACFHASTLDATVPHGALNSACGRAVSEAVRERLGPERAAALGHAIEVDLAERSAFK